MNLPAGYSARACTAGDLDAVVELLRAADLADIGETDPTREHIEESWRFPTTDISLDTRAVLRGDEMVAQAIVEGVNPERTLEIFGRVHPDHRGRGVGTALLEWSEARALERSPSLPVLRASTPATDGPGRALLERRGFAYARTFWHMRRSLAGDVESPAALEGIVLRPYRDDDLRATYDVIEEAFSEHWGFEPFTFEEHVHEMARMDPSLIVMASVDGDAVGTAFASLIEGEGWVDVIGVLRPWRGRGAAKAMLLTLFAALRAVGARSVTLNVDSENDTGATALYEAVGMRVHRAWWVGEKRFAAAEPV